MANFVTISILWDYLEAKRGDLGLSNEDFLRAVRANLRWEGRAQAGWPGRDESREQLLL